MRINIKDAHWNILIRAHIDTYITLAYLKFGSLRKGRGIFIFKKRAHAYT